MGPRGQCPAAAAAKGVGWRSKATGVPARGHTMGLLKGPSELHKTEQSKRPSGPTTAYSWWLVINPYPPNQASDQL